MRLAIIVLLSLTTAALAQAPAQPFVPYTINEQEHNWLMAQMGELPAKYVIPLMQALVQLEQQAQQRAAAAKAPAKPAVPSAGEGAPQPR